MFACSLLAVSALLPLLWQPGCSVFSECFLHTASEGGGVDLIRRSKVFLIQHPEWERVGCKSWAHQCPAVCWGGKNNSDLRSFCSPGGLLCTGVPIVWAQNQDCVGRAWKNIILTGAVHIQQQSLSAFMPCFLPFCAGLEHQGKKPKACNPCLQPLPAATLMLGTGS